MGTPIVWAVWVCLFAGINRLHVDNEGVLQEGVASHPDHEFCAFCCEAVGRPWHGRAGYRAVEENSREQVFGETSMLSSHSSAGVAPDAAAQSRSDAVGGSPLQVSGQSRKFLISPK